MFTIDGVAAPKEAVFAYRCPLCDAMPTSACLDDSGMIRYRFHESRWERYGEDMASQGFEVEYYPDVWRRHVRQQQRFNDLRALYLLTEEQVPMPPMKPMPERTQEQQSAALAESIKHKILVLLELAPQQPQSTEPYVFDLTPPDYAREKVSHE